MRIFSLLLSYIAYSVSMPSLSRDNIVSFGDLELFELRNYNLSLALCIQEDRLNKGSFLVCDLHALISVSEERNVEIIAGNPTESGFNNGPGYSAYFSYVYDIYQINDDDVIVMDSMNYCIRKVTRSTKMVSTFAGQCRRAGEFEGTVTASEARFRYLSHGSYLPQFNRIFYMLHKPMKIISHDLDKDLLTVVFNEAQIINPYGLVPDSEGRHFYVSHFHGISLVNISTWTSSLLTGSDRPPPPGSPPRNGPLGEADYGILDGIAWLIPDQVLIVAELSRNILRVVNLVNNLVSSICPKPPGLLPEYTLGGMDVCQVNVPQALAVINQTVYISSEKGRRDDAQQVFLALSYDVSVCDPPQQDNHGSFIPTKTKYSHLDTVDLKCEPSFGISLNDTLSSMTCVIIPGGRDGVVQGNWGTSPPTCEAASITEVMPNSGQKSGGTRVYVSGVLPDNTTAVIRQHGMERLHFKRRDLHSGYIIMTPKQNQSVVSISFEYSPGLTFYSFNYTYLENPQILSMSSLRRKGLASGGLAMQFPMKNVLSAYEYKLLFTFPTELRRGGSVIETECAVREAEVFCLTPEIVNSHSVTHHDEIVSGNYTLLGDDVPVGGALEVPFDVYIQEPIIISFVKDQEYTPHISPDVEIVGQDLLNGVEVSDFTVNLISEDRMEEHACEIQSITEDYIKCLPDEGIDVPRHQLALTLKVQVVVGNLNFTAGNLLVFRSPSKPPKPEEYLVPPYLIAVICIAVLIPILLCLIVMFVFIRRRRTAASVIPVSSRITGLKLTDGMDGSELELHLTVELRLKIKDMYIDPSKVTFNPSSEPIGTGHFGRVYMGQLNLTEENKLRTVAVKTLKDTTDIGIDELEEFLGEASFLKDFEHPNVLSVIGIIWRKGDRPQVILPYMSNGDLLTLIRKPDLTFTCGDLLHFCLQVGNGMEYLANNKLVHRDLAARNCLVDNTYLVKIGDFGMSRDIYTSDLYIERRSRPQPVCWMSPESLREGIYNELTDVWSFGVLMWEVTSRGATPYPGIDNSNILKHIMDGNKLVQTEHTPDVVYKLMCQCWSIKPEERPKFSQLVEIFSSLLKVTINNNEGLAERHYTNHISVIMQPKTANDYIDISENECSFTDRSFESELIKKNVSGENNYLHVYPSPNSRCQNNLYVTENTLNDLTASKDAEGEFVISSC